jgi:uncharacterized protein YjbJ (UPF0337 family)
MDRQRMQGGLKRATGTMKEKAGDTVGDRHLDTERRDQKTDHQLRSDPLDAVREVVKNEG